VVTTFGISIGLLSVGAKDWPQYRGPGTDGISTDRITTQWSGSVTNPLWKVTITNGLSAFCASGGRAVTQIKRRISGVDKDFCVAYSTTNGVELWATAIENTSYPQGGVGSDDGPRTTPSIENGSVYVLSSQLKLFRLNATNGSVIWSTNLLSGFGGSVIGWQNAASPLLEGDFIILNANCGSQTLLAIRKADGRLGWRAQENEAMTHSTPVVATVCGVPQVIFATQSGLVALRPQDGSRLWRYIYPFSYSTSLAISPLVHQDTVFISGAYNMGSAAAKVSLANGTWSVTELWYDQTLQSHWMTPVCHQGFIYGHFGSGSTSPFKCIELATGVERWSVDNFGRGGTVLVDDRILALTESGQLRLIVPNPDSFTELARFQAVTGKCWNSPAVCDGRVYLRSTSQGAAFDFSMPELKMDCLPAVSGGGLQIRISTSDGSAVSSNRAAALELLAGTTLDAPMSAWTKLTNGPKVANGVVLFENLVPGTNSSRFFRVRENQ
jgi:outer membrane protein assembly factor BamB